MNGGTYLRDRAARIEQAASLENGEPCSGVADSAVFLKLKRITGAQMRSDAIPLVRLALTDPFFDARAAAAIALGKLATPSCPDFNEIVADVRKLLADSDKQVREAACLSLGLLGDKSVVPDLLSIMNDEPRGRELSGHPLRRVLVRQRAFAAIAIGLIGRRETLDDSVIAELTAAARGHVAESRPASRPR